MNAFRGPESLRCRGETATFVWTLLSLPLSIIVVGWVLQHQLTYAELALLLVAAMVYVAFARGRLLGGGLRVHDRQFGHVWKVVDECARMLRVPTPHVFIRDDPFVPVVAIGIGEPYAIVISAQFVEAFQDDELRFLVGRELGHIASGHTRFTSLLSSNGRENGVIAIIFGAWLRKIDYTADRVGLLCCGSLDAAIRAIAVSTFQHVGRKVDLGAFAEQLKELQAEPSLRLAEWTASTPYATHRVSSLHHFARDPLYITWARRVAENAALPPATSTEGSYAGFWRRAWALVVDLAVLQALVPAAKFVSTNVKLDDNPRIHAVATSSDASGFAKWLDHVHFSTGFSPDALVWFAFFAYAVVLVALTGQTFGMMVSDLRVVCADRGCRVGFWAALSRYLALIASMFAVIGWWSLFRRVQPYEKWSRTRLVSGSQAARS
ncbi:MAG TPA: RDD family protein [Candidatus Elarobacter sp.]